MADRSSSQLTPAFLAKLRARANRKRAPWTADELETLRLNYSDFPTYLVAFVCGHCEAATYRKARLLGIRKSDDFLRSDWSGRLQKGSTVGATGRFPKGHVPANKGLRRPGWAPGRMATTQFQKGRPAQDARNYKPIGSMKVDHDGYLVRKVTDDPSIVPARRWIAVHRLVWEAAHGPSTGGHMVTFKPGRRTTEVDAITADGLELITMAENGRRNIFHHRYPEEVVDLIRLKTRLTRIINRRARDEEQNV